MRRLLIGGILPLFLTTACFAAGRMDTLKSLIGPRDSILVADPGGDIIVSKNARKLLVPASILKIFTSLVALNYLGRDFRFQTDFYLDETSNLIIKGYGDPLLVSEVVDEIARILSLA